MGQLKAREDDDVIARVDEEAERLDISRAAYVRAAVREKLPVEKENDVPVKYRRYNWTEYRDVARTIDSYENLADALPERLNYPFGTDMNNEIPEIDGAKDAPLRYIIIRGILDGIQESRAQSEDLEDTGEYPNLLIEDMYEKMGVSDTTRWRDMPEGKLMERGVAYPLPAVDPKFSRDKFYERLLKALYDGQSSAGYNDGHVAPIDKLREHYPLPEVFFEDISAEIVPSDDVWVRSEREYIDAVEGHTQAIRDNLIAIKKKHNTEFAIELVRAWREFLESRDVIPDEVVDILPVFEEERISRTLILACSRFLGFFLCYSEWL